MAKKPEPVLGESPNVEVKKTTEPVKNESKNPVANKDMKPDTYDKLFGNGIV